MNTKFTCDETFAYYLYDVCPKVNSEYFHFIIKFIILFRECINNYRSKNSEQSNEGGSKEFTTYGNSETVPDLCNEFITDFMEINDYFGLDTNELIEIIQHLCYWLYMKSFTASRLTLLNN